MLTNRQDVQAELENIPDAEPVLFLRAQDSFAAETARHYARLHREHGGNPDAAELADAHAEALQAYTPPSAE